MNRRAVTGSIVVAAGGLGLWLGGQVLPAPFGLAVGGVGLALLTLAVLSVGGAISEYLADRRAPMMEANDPLTAILASAGVPPEVGSQALELINLLCAVRDLDEEAAAELVAAAWRGERALLAESRIVLREGLNGEAALLGLQRRFVRELRLRELNNEDDGLFGSASDASRTDYLGSARGPEPVASSDPHDFLFVSQAANPKPEVAARIGESVEDGGEEFAEWPSEADLDGDFEGDYLDPPPDEEEEDEGYLPNEPAKNAASSPRSVSVPEPLSPRSNPEQPRGTERDLFGRPLVDPYSDELDEDPDEHAAEKPFGARLRDR